MNREFIKNEDGYIIGVTQEKTIRNYDFIFNGLGYTQVLITQEKNYYNIYIIDERFKQDPLNCLQLQEPKSKKILNSFTELYAYLRATEKEIWFKYGNPNKEEVLSFNIEVFKE